MMNYSQQAAHNGQLVLRFVNIQTILAAFVILGVLYSLATPIFEKPDEPRHFAYVKMLADGRGFPSDLTSEAIDAPQQESSQPPLYYAVAALAVRVFASDTRDFVALQQENPVSVSSLVDNDNKNLYVHRDGETAVWQGTILAVRVARWVALIFGMIAIWASYRLGREMFPERITIGLAAAGLVAFLPQFIFISSSASNDSTVAATCALALWSVAYIVRRGLSMRRAIGLGVALGLAALSKVGAIALVPLALFVIVASLRAVPWRTLITSLALTLGVILLIAGPWYLRSALVFGDPLGLTTHLLKSARPEQLGILEAARKLLPSIKSFWLAYGWGTVLAPAWVYVTLNTLGGIGLLAALYVLAAVRESRTRWLLIMLFAWIVVVAVLLVRWNQLIGAPLGRLLFPAIAAIATLIAVGWTTIAASIQRRVPVLRSLAAILPLSLLALSIIAIPAVLMPAYARPTFLRPEQIAQRPGTALAIRYGDVARLIKVNLPHDPRPRPDETAFVQLCWETLAPDPRELMVSIQLVGANESVVARRRTLPGLGSYPVAHWRPGTYFCDEVPVHIDSATPAPAIYQVEVSLIDQTTGERLTAYAPDGSALHTNFVSTMKVEVANDAGPEIAHRVSQRLGDQIDLIGYQIDPGSARPGETVRLRLYWRANQHPAVDYTVFVHVSDATGRMVMQADSPPQDGTYPTSIWDVGEVVTDEHLIQIPPDALPGDYTVAVGLYQLDTGERLPVTGNGTGTEVKLPMILTVAL